jgi:hypothetical protein
LRLPRKKIEALVEELTPILKCRDRSKQYNTLKHYDLIGCGASRAVLALNKHYVLKCKITNPSFNHQNKREVHVWDKVKKTKVAKYFAPISWHSKDFLFVVQRRGYNKPTMSTVCKLETKLTRINEPKLNHILDCVCTDLHQGNVRELNNQFRIIDYGWSNQ